jgi:hypothetical protein
MHSQDWATDGEYLSNFTLVDRLVAANTELVIQIWIEGAMQMDFSVLPIISPLAEQLGFKGSLEGERTLAIINAYSTGFFDHYLFGLNPIDIDALKNEFPEAAIDLSHYRY